MVSASSTPPNEPAIDADGWWRGAARLPSPNFDARPAEVPIDLLVLHNISLPPGEFGGGQIERLFQNQLEGTGHPFLALLEGVRVSAHFLIRRDGRAVQFVAVTDRAWHAGTSTFAGRSRCNDYSVGIELEGCDFVPFTNAQYDTLAVLTRALRKHLPLAAVRGHSDIARDRKTDPGPLFDWDRYAREAGLSSDWLPNFPR